MMRDVFLVTLVALCTFATRFFPFALFGGAKEPPAAIKYIGRILPSSVIAILIVYCSKAVRFDHFISSVPHFIAIGIVVLLHLWKRNNLLSIGGGTLCYMFMIQMF